MKSEDAGFTLLRSIYKNGIATTIGSTFSKYC